MDRPFVTTYSDILFTGDVVRGPGALARRHRARRRHRLARALPAAHPASAARRREGDHARTAASCASIAAFPTTRRPASSSASRSSARAAAQLLREHYHRRQARVLGQAVSRGAAVPEGVPDPSLPGHDRAGRRVRPRRHARQLSRDRHAGRLGSRAERLWNADEPALPLFPASVVGSMPRPLVRARADREAAVGRGRRARDGCRDPLRRGACRSAPGSTSSPTASGGGARISASSPSSRTASRSRPIRPTAGPGRW